MRIECPCCGKRAVSEFTYLGDATRTRPSTDEIGLQPWEAYIFRRSNPVGDHAEHWQHTGGCRALLRVVRNTRTHRIHSVSLCGPWAELTVEDDGLGAGEISE